MLCTYHCQFVSFNLKKISTLLGREGFIHRFFDDVLYIEIGKDEDAFLFPYGCVVFWNVSKEKQHQILQICALEHPVLQEKTVDSCHFTYGNKTHIYEEEDMIELESNDILIRLSLSHALSQSVKLEVFESSVLKTIENTRPLTNQIHQKGKTFLSRSQISKLIGKLFEERNSINLDTDLLDIPEFFWRRPSYEPYYDQAAKYMDINARLEILNRRLDSLHDLYEFLSNELNHSHSSFLEWIIIFLIGTEIIITILKDILKLF